MQNSSVDRSWAARPKTKSPKSVHPAMSLPTSQLYQQYLAGHDLTLQYDVRYWAEHTRQAPCTGMVAVVDMVALSARNCAWVLVVVHRPPLGYNALPTSMCQAYMEGAEEHVQKQPVFERWRTTERVGLKIVDHSTEGHRGPNSPGQEDLLAYFPEVLLAMN